MARLALSILLAYLLGSIPCTYLAGWLLGLDLSRRGSGNLGGTNAIRVLGPLPGFLAGLADVGKAALAVLIARRLAGDYWAPALAAVAAALGHSYSLYLRLAKGGKGVSTVIGAFLYLAPLPTTLGLAAALGLVLATRYVSLGSLVFVSLLPPLLFLLRQPWPWIAAAAAMAILVFWRHRGNIRRLREGTERRIGEKHVFPQERSS